MSTFSPARPKPLSTPLARTRVRARRLPAPELFGLLALAAVLNLWSLSRNGWANDYYAAAVRSMSTSWHNFFFGSFDASGIMTVDKPPLALWAQALSARIFGFHSLSVLVPQALMGIASVALVYDLTRRVFGRAAGFVAGLVLALTPITVAISRHNNPDALLVLLCVGAVWALVRAFEDGRTRWLILSGLLVGLGFETKMAVALMVLPGIAAAWLWFRPKAAADESAAARASAASPASAAARASAASPASAAAPASAASPGFGRRIRQLLAGGAAMTIAGLAWPVAVWLTPAADRPWISGTSNNSIWSLILGYNGLGRLSGQNGGPGGGGPGGGGPGGNAGPFGGSAGPFRLLNEALGGQAGWLLGFAIVSVAAVAVVSRMRRDDRRAAWVLAVGGAFAVTAVAFSFAQGIFHPYYVSLLAPFSAALVGAGVGLILQGGRTMKVLGPLAVLAGAGTEIAVLSANPGQLSWLKPVLVIVAVTAAAVLANPGGARWRSGAIATALVVLMLAPASWAFDTLGHATSGTFPAGGPASASFGRGGGPGGIRGNGGRPAGGSMQAPPAGALGQPSATPPAGGGFGGTPSGGFGGAGRLGANDASLTAALAYAKAHGGGTVAVASQDGASASIINSDSNVVAIGGFSGRESQVSIQWFAQHVAAGKIRWVVADSQGGGLPTTAAPGRPA